MRFTANNRTRTMAYYLADGIYPRYAFFATPYSDAGTPKKLHVQSPTRSPTQRC